MLHRAALKAEKLRTSARLRKPLYSTEAGNGVTRQQRKRAAAFVDEKFSVRRTTPEEKHIRGARLHRKGNAAVGICDRDLAADAMFV